MFAADGSVIADIRAGRLPLVGDGASVFSFVHVDDVATAVLAALDRDGPGVLNIVDDEPSAIRDWLPSTAAMLNAPPPRRLPTFLARLAAGGWGVTYLSALRGADNTGPAHLGLGAPPSLVSFGLLGLRETDAMSDGQVRPMTWNIWWRFGPHWQDRQPGILETMERLSPDVVALQEVWGNSEATQAHELNASADSAVLRPLRDVLTDAWTAGRGAADPVTPSPGSSLPTTERSSPTCAGASDPLRSCSAQRLLSVEGPAPEARTPRRDRGLLPGCCLRSGRL
jgi:hypothetical protein